MTGLAREASACSATIRTSGLPLISSSSLFGPPMRVERPAASTRPAIRWPFSGSGTARGCGRVTISINRPPTPSPVMSERLIGRPASRRIRIQSKPFSFGERAQPGAPSTGRPFASATSIRLPGSTGMPKCSIRPPTASTAAGITSRVSAMADAPNTTTISAPAFSTSSSALASALVSCGTRRSATIMAPAGASRSCVTRKVFSITLSASPGSTVEMMPTLRSLNGATRTIGCAARAAATALSRAAPATAKGMIFTVAIILPATTGA